MNPFRAGRKGKKSRRGKKETPRDNGEVDNDAVSPLARLIKLIAPPSVLRPPARSSSLEVEVGVPLVVWGKPLATPGVWNDEELDEIYRERHARYMPSLIYSEEIFFPPSFNREAYDREWRDISPPFIPDEESVYSTCGPITSTPLPSRSPSPPSSFSEDRSSSPREISPPVRDTRPPARMGRGGPANGDIPRGIFPPPMGHGRGRGGMGRGAPSLPARRPGGLQQWRE